MKDMFLKGGALMWPLLVCSIVSLAITFERIFFWWRERRKRNPERLERILGLIESGDSRDPLSPEDEKAVPLHSLDSFSRIVVSGFSHRSQGWRESIEIAAEDEIERMKQGLNILDTIITMAPLLGILGTVLGIIQSFDLLGASGIEDPKAVTGGIAQALITTAAGLTVALVTLVPFNYFVSKVNRAAKDMNRLTARFEAACGKGSGGVGDDL
jgi:biopolymer transport protein ExbB